MTSEKRKTKSENEEGILAMVKLYFVVPLFLMRFILLSDFHFLVPCPTFSVMLLIALHRL